MLTAWRATTATPLPPCPDTIVELQGRRSRRCGANACAYRGNAGYERHAMTSGQ
jgi:hypothetical protein